MINIFSEVYKLLGLEVQGPAKTNLFSVARRSTTGHDRGVGVGLLKSLHNTTPFRRHEAVVL